MKKRLKNQSLTRKFRFALAGLAAACKHEKNLRLHLVAATITVGLFAWLQPAAVWWGLIALAIALVIAAELINAALETTLDHLHPEIHPRIRQAKDMAAAAVLILSIGALAVGILALLASR